MKYSKYNVLIIGSGLAGLFLANKLATSALNLSDGIALVTKTELFSGSSSIAQGGIVCVAPEINKSDSIESHIKDTLKAGCGINNLNTVNFVSSQSADAIQELISFGVEFDRNKSDKTYNFTLEAAHCCPRILHCKGDSTGKEIEKTLVDRIQKQDNIDIYSDSVALELLVDSKNVCKGVVIFNKNTNSFEAIYSSIVVIATGGIGQIYKATTNPLTSTGDGIALAYRAGAQVENMEFVQFHPSALYVKDKISMPLVSESVRGEGAKLVDIEGNYFAKNYHNLADLAPRDVVARAIKTQMSQNNFEYVNLDISQIGIEKFKQRFPTICALCNENNIDIDNGLIPVIPAQHYFMGGIKVDINSSTDIKNLYALGECASTGLHGANRLASNSLLECVVFARKLANDIMNMNLDAPKKNDYKIKVSIEKYFDIDLTNENISDIKLLFNRLKNVMSDNVSIIREQKGLNKALFEINSIEEKLNEVVCQFNIDKFELQNALLVAKLITSAALNRKNSIGAHYRSDYPDAEIIENKEQTANDTKDEILA